MSKCNVAYDFFDKVVGIIFVHFDRSEVLHSSIILIKCSGMIVTPLRGAVLVLISDERQWKCQGQGLSTHYKKKHKYVPNTVKICM